ncbi:Outer membrane protein beta-barrel domain-containing protein [Dyadobacter soli]|uniref:Outer membrane protein beta-barrel domain-containing protein n=1 Tax=Dyadobacter soli TaxID=659014 RepID=A0A1G7FUF7_9BACT|nr:porin family protein [Dyadobacter soli]SDE79508.1 Outer membrane protein beta-barrel domain-containing protein [Dyadobacter soli]
MRTFQRLLKAALSLTTCALITNTAQAQLSLGVKGGVNFSSLVVKDDDFTNFSERVAPNFAIIFNYQIAPTFSIQAEPGFSARGVTIRPSNSTPVIVFPGSPHQRVEKGVLKIGYFELPIVAQYRPRLTEKLEAIISAGPEIRFRTGPQRQEVTTATYVNGEKVGTVTRKDSYSGDDAVSVFDAGVTAGAGLAYPIGRLKVYVEGRYHLGLYNLASNTNDGDAYDSKVHNRGASVVLGVTVPIFK